MRGFCGPVYFLLPRHLMIPFPCSKKHVLAKTSSGRPIDFRVFYVVLSNNRCRPVLKPSLLTTSVTPPFPFPFGLYTQCRTVPFTSFSTFFVYFAFLCWVRSTILSFRIHALRSSPLLSVAAMVVVLPIHGNVAFLFRRVISCPYFTSSALLLFMHNLSFLFYSFYPLQLCPPCNSLQPVYK